MPKGTTILQDVQNVNHLNEDQDAQTFLIHGSEELIEDDHLARVFDEALVGRVRWARFLKCVNSRDVSDQDKTKCTTPSKRYGWQVTFRSCAHTQSAEENNRYIITHLHNHIH